MIKQCGNCKWWELTKTIVEDMQFGTCNAAIPSSVIDIGSRNMLSHYGSHCPVFEERKE